MGLFNKNKELTEWVEFEKRPHWRALLLPILLGIAIVGLAFWLLYYFEDALFYHPDTQRLANWAVILGAIILFLVFVLRPLISYMRTKYIFTNQRIIVKGKNRRVVSLDEISDLQLHRGPLDRAFGAGKLEATVPGDDEEGPLILPAVPQAAKIYKQMEALRTGNYAEGDYDQQLLAGQAPDQGQISQEVAPENGQNFDQPASLPGDDSTDVAPPRRGDGSE